MQELIPGPTRIAGWHRRGRKAGRSIRPAFLSLIPVVWLALAERRPTRERTQMKRLIKLFSKRVWTRCISRRSFTSGTHAVTRITQSRRVQRGARCSNPQANGEQPPGLRRSLPHVNKGHSNSFVALSRMRQRTIPNGIHRRNHGNPTHRNT